MAAVTTVTVMSARMPIAGWEGTRTSRRIRSSCSHCTVRQVCSRHCWWYWWVRQRPIQLLLHLFTMLIAGSAKAAAQALDGVQEDLQMKLEKLTKRAPVRQINETFTWHSDTMAQVMLFMKGSPENAKCKFSKQAMGLTVPVVSFSGLTILCKPHSCV